MNPRSSRGFRRRSPIQLILLGALAAIVLMLPHGTAAQTAELVADLRNGTGGSDPQELTNLDSALYFSADDGARGRKLWRHILKTKTTEIVTDAVTGAFVSSPTGLTNLFGKLYFAADDGGLGRELWRYDPGTGKAELLKDIRPGPMGSSPQSLTIVADVLFFTANDGTHGRELWARLPDSEGSAPFLVQDINPNNAPNPEGEVAPNSLTAVNDTLFFAANDGMHGYEVWSVNAFSFDVQLVRDLALGTDSSLPGDLVNFNGMLFFTAFDASVSPGRRLWQSNGTSAGTAMFGNVIVNNPESGSLHALVPVDKKLFFAGTTAAIDDAELFVTDGTAAGTARVKDILPGFRSSLPAQLTKVFGVLFFRARDGTFADPPPDGDNAKGSELWRSDGTEAGTRMVKDIFPTPIPPNLQGIVANSSTPNHLTGADGNLFFSAVDADSNPTGNGPNDSNLWMSDGTEAGTVRVQGLPNKCNPDNLAYVGTTLFFTATDSARGRELWKVTLPDADGDGLLDKWETSGIDYDMDGTPDLNLPALGARPNHKDLFVEIDYMTAAGHSHRPQQAGLDAVLDAFRRAPVANPDGAPGIHLVLEMGEAIPEQTPVAFGLPLSKAATTFADLKRRFFGGVNDRATARLIESRRLAYRYAIFGHEHVQRIEEGGRLVETILNGSVGEQFGDDFLVNFGGWTDKQLLSGGGTTELLTARATVEAGVLMHELGHTLGLDHGGGDAINGKPNYLSVMNYSFATRNLDVTRPLDYSRQALATINESDFFSPVRLNETLGIGGPAGRNTVYGLIDFKETTTLHLLDGIDNDRNGIIDRYVRVTPANGPIDWNGDGRINPATDFLLENVHDLRRRIDKDGDFMADTEITYVDDLNFHVLKGFNDWENLRYNFRDAFGSRTPFQFPSDPNAADLSGAQIEAGAALLASTPAVVADLAVVKTSPSAMVLAGTNLTYTITVTNKGPGTAPNVVMSDNLPATLTFVSATSTAGGVSAGSGNSRTITFASLASGASGKITLVAKVNSTTAPGTLIRNTASVTAAVTDPDSTNNSSTIVNKVAAPNQPPVISNLSVDRPQLEPRKKELVPVTVNYTATDDSGPPVCVLSITSTEVPKDKDKGNKDKEEKDKPDKTTPDWVIVDAHHVCLRAEIGKHSEARIYTITVTCRDSAGLSASKSVNVEVRKSKK